jgi:hypothetical protein
MRLAASRRQRGEAIASVLDVLRCDAALWERVLGAGHHADLWTRPYLWDPAIGQRRFPGGGTPAFDLARSPPVRAP